MPETKVRARLTLGKQGRLVIPAEMRNALGFMPGDQLVVRAEGDRLVVEKVEAVERRLLARFAALPPGVSLVDELLAERREAARREAEEIYAPDAHPHASRRVAEDTAD